MMETTKRAGTAPREGRSRRRTQQSHWKLGALLAIAQVAQCATAAAAGSNNAFPQYRAVSVPGSGSGMSHHMYNRALRPTRRQSASDWKGKIPLSVVNNCGDKIWPGILSTNGVGPGTGGFELAPGSRRDMWVSPNWEGRVWGRTNCTVNGDSCSCTTGDCWGALECQGAGAPPATLAEITLLGGNGCQNFYDISLVDGYNLPMGIVYVPAGNTSSIPPNLSNLACIATPGWLWPSAKSGTAYSNDTFPVPWESSKTNANVRNWCPWPDLAFPPAKPGDGVFPYPDDNIHRPDFSPCRSQCDVTGAPEDCCTGDYNDPSKCKRSLYSSNAKTVCPDAYSFAYDDHSSTFVLPCGGGYEVVFCPNGRSTNILEVIGAQLAELGSVGHLTNQSRAVVSNATYINDWTGAAGETKPGLRMALVAAGLVALCLAL